MATLRHSGFANIFRFTAQPTSTSRCARCLKAQRCPFSSNRISRSGQGAKRPLMTESSFRSSAVSDSLPPMPPRNSGTPDTSINNASSQTSWPAKTPWQTDASVRESEAQVSRAVLPAVEVDTSSEAQPATTTKPARKSKLKARKAALHLTPTAVEHLKQLHEQPDGKFIRVGVKNRGCSGLAYHLEYVDKPGSFDETVEQDGVKVLIDSKALFSIIGSEMDWAEDKLAARFVFKNPNITEQCGCGESFSIG